MGYDAKTERLISLKKLAGKAQTSNDKGLANEGLPSGLTVSSNTVFGQAISTSPGSTTLYETTGFVEYLRFPVVFIAGSDTSSGRHGFELKLPSDYEANSTNPNKGSYPFKNNQVLNITSGSLQLIPPSYSTSYEAKPFYGGTSAKDSGTQIPILDARDWYMDYFNGIMFQQDPPGTGDHSNNPDYVEAYLYIGKYLDAVVSQAGSSGGADPNAQYLVLTATGSLANERVINPGTGLNGNDGGAGNNYTLSIDNSVVATLTGSQFSGNVGITGSLGVNGDVEVTEYIKHIGDSDTFIQFADDAIGITAGGEQLITISEAGQDIVKIGDGGDVDFQVRTLNDDNTLYIEGSTDRIGIGTSSPSSILHIKEAGPTLTLQRENNSNASTINFIGASANTANSIIHDSSTNDLIFKTFNGSSVEEILRLGDHYGTSVRQVTILSGANMPLGTMQPRLTSDIAFFVSGSINSIGTSIRGASVFGGDVLTSGSITAITGLTGSLTSLKNGTPYLRSGTGISITTGSLGEVTISRSSSGVTRNKKNYVISSDVNALDPVSVTNSDMSTVNYDPNLIDVYVNGQIMMSGSSSDVSGNAADYYVSTATSLRFGFKIRIDDVLTVTILKL